VRSSTVTGEGLAGIRRKTCRTTGH
jgi:hypothetical protein